MRRIILLTTAALLILVGVAFAADAAPAVNPIGDALAGLLKGDVTPLIMAALSALIGLVLDKLRQKYSMQISAERQAQLVTLAQQGVGIAEEKAAQMIKANVTKMTGQNKLDLAIAHIIGMAPKVTVEQADALVHYVLAKSTGAGATGSQTV